MKTSTIFKSVVVVALFAFSTSNLLAQTGTNYHVVNPAATPIEDPKEVIDTVPKGGRMAYYVKPHVATATAVAAGFLDASVYKWIFKDDADALLGTQPAVLKYDGTGASKVTISTVDYYQESEISVEWTAVGSYEIEATERSRPKVGTGCESSTTTSRVVVVQDLPTFKFPATKTTGACVGGTTAFSIPVTLSGSGPWKVTYTITDGTLSETVTKDVTNGKMPYTSEITTLTMPVDVTEGVLTGAAGTYTVTVDRVTDRITQKALNAYSFPGNTTGLTGVVDGSNKVFTIGIIAAPTTSPIQHIKNL